MSQNPAFLVAMVVGTIMLLTVCHVYAKKQTFGVGGATLSCLGVALLGMSVWRSMDFQVSSSGISARLDRVEAAVKDTGTRVEQAQAQASQAAAQSGSLAQRFDVAAMQQSLKSKGLYSGVADGRFDADTADAVARFQALKGLPKSGRIDAETLRQLDVKPVSDPASFAKMPVQR